MPSNPRPPSPFDTASAFGEDHARSIRFRLDSSVAGTVSSRPLPTNSTAWERHAQNQVNEAGGINFQNMPRVDEFEPALDYSNYRDIILNKTTAKEPIKTVSKEASAELWTILKLLKEESLKRLSIIYSERLTNISNNDIEFSIDVIENGLSEPEYSMHRYITVCSNVLHHMLRNEAFTPHDRVVWNYITDKINKKFNIEYSKYKYYPRLKNKVKFGNAEILNELLEISDVDRGKPVLCQL